MRKRLIALILSSFILATSVVSYAGDASTVTKISQNSVVSVAEVRTCVIAVTISSGENGNSEIIANPYDLQTIEGTAPPINETITIENTGSNIPVQIKLYGKVQLPAAGSDRTKNVTMGSSLASVQKNTTSKQVYVQAIVADHEDNDYVLAKVTKSSTGRYTFTKLAPLVYKSVASTVTSKPAMYGTALSVPIVIGTQSQDAEVSDHSRARDKYDTAGGGNIARCVDAVDIVITGAISKPALVEWDSDKDVFKIITTYDIQIGKPENLSPFTK